MQHSLPSQHLNIWDIIRSRLSSSLSLWQSTIYKSPMSLARALMLELVVFEFVRRTVPDVIGPDQLYFYFDNVV